MDKYYSIITSLIILRYLDDINSYKFWQLEEGFYSAACFTKPGHDGKNKEKLAEPSWTE